MAMEVQIDIEPFHTLIKLMSMVDKTITLNFDTEGIESSLIDSTKSFAVSASIPKEKIDVYKLDKKELVHLDSTNVLTFIKACEVKGTEKIKIKIKDEDEQSIVFSVGRLKRKMRRLESNELYNTKRPGIEFKTSFSIDGSALKNAVLAVNTVSDVTKFKADLDKILLQGFDTNDEIEVIFNKTDASIKDYDNPEDDTTSMFASEWLRSVINFVTKTPVFVEMGKDFPLRLSWEFTDKCNAEAFFAPRVEME